MWYNHVITICDVVPFIFKKVLNAIQNMYMKNEIIFSSHYVYESNNIFQVLKYCVKIKHYLGHENKVTENKVLS